VSLPHVNPDAPKGGTITLGEHRRVRQSEPVCTQKELRPVASAHESLIRSWTNLALYGLSLAETIEVPDSRAWVEFYSSETA
jgi:peptide/nickel transport system substrate-binding protein